MNCRGIILAGGENSRMNGFPKGKIRLGGKRLFDRIHEVLRSIVPDVAVSVHDNAPINLPESLTIIRDHYPNNRSSMNGVYSALQKSQVPVIIVPWDMPFVTNEQLQQLTQGESEDNRMGTFYQLNDVIQPFPGLYRPQMIDRLKKKLKQGELSIRKILKESQVSVIDPSTDNNFKNLTPRHFMNLNSPEELKMLGNIQPTSK